MSDRVDRAPTLETRMDDARAVMDAAGSSRAALFGSSEGAAMSLLFAATYPERTAALVFRSAYPRTMWAPDYPWGRSEDEYRHEMDRDLRLFGPRDQALEAVRSRIQLDSDQEAHQWVDYFRWSGSPGAVEALALMNKEIDVRHVLPEIDEFPERETDELAIVLEREGLSRAQAETVARGLASNPNVFLRTKVEKELGLSPDAGGAALGDALVVGATYLGADLAGEIGAAAH